VDLPGLKTAVPGLGGKSHNDKIKIFGWWLHTHDGKAVFAGADILKCYDDLHLARPSSIGPYLEPLVKKKELLRSSGGYRLAAHIRDELGALYGQNPVVVQISTMLAGLPAKLPNLAERTYLDEAIACYGVKAVRATIVMTWNLAYAHLCDHIVKHRLADFNARWQSDYKGDHKAGLRAILTVDDFAAEELKEQKVLKIALDAGIVVKNVYNVLEPALKRRNAAAHPNNMVLTSLQTEAFIEDLVNNVILKLT
jgi:hypothetical protein